jgi:glucose-1-phosphate cytidylyltransferase
VNLTDNKIEIHNSNAEPFKVTMIDTGVDTMTAGRLKRVLQYTNNEPFLLTYGDGVADVDINATIDFHKQHQKVCTMTVIQPSSRFGVVNMDEDGTVLQFEEKPEDSGTWINGGFFVIEPTIKNYLTDPMIDQVMWERQPMYDLAQEKQIVGYRHRGFWKCMDTMRDKEELEKLWLTNPLWKKW